MKRIIYKCDLCEEEVLSKYDSVIIIKAKYGWDDTMKRKQYYICKRCQEKIKTFFQNKGE